MIKTNIFGVNYSVTNYSQATNLIIEHAQKNVSFGVTALAVHGLVESYKSPMLKEMVNKINLIVPDGQPIRWAMNHFYQTKLLDRVYGPELTLRVLKKSNDLGLNIYLYGSKQATLYKLTKFIETNFSNINIVGVHADRFREATLEEDSIDINSINHSKAHIVLVGRGCPRQEVWVSNHIGKVNAVMMAVGAAFDFHAGTVEQAPKWMQDRGLEWFFRLTKEPKRLWKRYLFTNTMFIYLFTKKKLGFNV